MALAIIKDLKSLKCPESKSKSQRNVSDKVIKTLKTATVVNMRQREKVTPPPTHTYTKCNYTQKFLTTYYSVRNPYQQHYLRVKCLKKMSSIYSLDRATDMNVHELNQI